MKIPDGLFKFALIKVYGDYKNGHAPSAAEVWGMLEDGKSEGLFSVRN